ncbi:hypothetical protein [Streptomyces rubradiris]|uniref:Uncharacterized protein n=1 Tax=Streptomyces rubradiris TaxID=285531 RepID=A0ABQ3RA38_STRRR|nr:hypothetical protein [Streptomyces rubradiris]GHH25715.1 hypothetical protein GCM10018792_65060 [Streptomyces rubradiris]GHI52711.1 hypothetical protein Srubr_25570 [Streptomyces rubradiris]
MHEEHFRPWGHVSPDFWATVDSTRGGGERPEAAPRQAVPAESQPPPSPEPGDHGQDQDVPEAAKPAAQKSGQAVAADLPPGFHERIFAVTSAFNRPEDRHGLALAGIEAEKLDEELTELYGQHHTYTINVRELRGWLAYLSGDAGTAARWYLHTTGLQIQVHGPAHAQTQGSVRRAVHTWQQVTNPADIVGIGTGLVQVVAAVLGPESEAARFVQNRLKQTPQPQR